MARNALIVGFDDYYKSGLAGSINDAEEVARMLKYNEDGTANFSLTVLKGVPSRSELKSAIVKLFLEQSDIALFYFAGHGCFDPFGYHIVTPDAVPHDLGVAMNQLLALINGSNAKNKIIILDCCHAGGVDEMVEHAKGMSVYLCNGVTILASSQAKERAAEQGGHGVFTRLFVEAVKGGAADLNGNITPASIYAFIDKLLGPGQQRPVFKTNISEFISLRKVTPQVPPEVMQNLTTFFPVANDVYPLDPSYEKTNDLKVVHPVLEPYADQTNILKFQQLQKLQSVGIVVPVDKSHMYFAAMESTGCKLTELGKHYWQLIKNKESKS